MDSLIKNNNRCIGLLAHVDAGKTTLAEAMLYCSGTLKTLGRVDHRDSFLDTDSIERMRGITIFSKQARLTWKNTDFTLLDTPGHVDFSGETERTLSVLDCAVLVISGTDGVQAHTETLWRLLRRYNVPCFIFVSKMDLDGANYANIMADLKNHLDPGCIDFMYKSDDFSEQVALCNDKITEKFLDTNEVSDSDIAQMISRRELFPCFFGSGLRLNGVEELLCGLEKYSPCTVDKGDFGAKIFKIARDNKGQRVSFLKITGGSLKVRTALKYIGEDGNEYEEKCNQIRLYSGLKYDTAETASAGQVCAVTGLSATYPGQGLGEEANSDDVELEPVMSYRIIINDGEDPALLLPKIQLLQEEDPLLHVVWSEEHHEIEVSLMGKVQTEVFCAVVKERFDNDISLDTGRVLYRETIADKVEGVGHFEPLRHYAEVHLILQPLERGSGLVFDTVCSEDRLDRNWQRLILSQLQEKQHRGVLTGAPITDMKITLAAGRAHEKHTEGGDFREAAYRAVRQGLMNAQSVLLEPWYAFRLEVPAEQLGRAINDIRAMNGTFDSPEEAGDLLRISGSAPAVQLNGYSEELLHYTKGRGRLSLRPDGYRPCKEQDKIVSELGYEPERDINNTPDSVFCAHGAGFNVKWNEVPEYMHLDSVLKKNEESLRQSVVHRTYNIDERELEAIMEREFGPIRRKSYSSPTDMPDGIEETQREVLKKYAIVDGYNMIFAWDELKALASESLDLARTRLQDILINFAAFTRTEVVLVYDGYRQKGNIGSHSELNNIQVVYTKDGETADAYIERLVDGIGKNYRVRVITSDNLIRLSALRSGVLRTSSKEFSEELIRVQGEIKEFLEKNNSSPLITRLKDERS